jgi:ParB family chromosome partitioning protein
VKPAESAALKAALEVAQIEMVPLSALVKSPLNVRIIPYPPESVREMADSILAVGLIQNLVVHSLPDGLSGVAAGVVVWRPCSFYSASSASMPGIWSS